jgi:hypothetical protein
VSLAKPIKISLLETPRGYIVERFTNTTQLSIGLEVTRERVDKWVEMKGVEIAVVGKVEDREKGFKL